MANMTSCIKYIRRPGFELAFKERKRCYATKIHLLI